MRLFQQVVEATAFDGTVIRKAVQSYETQLTLTLFRLVALSDSVAQLTHVDRMMLLINHFTEIPAVVLTMTQLTCINMLQNFVSAIPPEIGRLTALKFLSLDDNRLKSLPREIGQLNALEWLTVDRNALTSLPAELGQLSSLTLLTVRSNRLTWLPHTLSRLPATMDFHVQGNPLDRDVGPAWSDENWRALLPDVLAATTALAMIRDDATTIAIGLQDLSLPALVTLEIVDAAFPNSIPMHLKWKLITTIKHFHPS